MLSLAAHHRRGMILIRAPATRARPAAPNVHLWSRGLLPSSLCARTSSTTTSRGVSSAKLLPREGQTALPSAIGAVALLVGGNLYSVHRLTGIQSEDDVARWVCNAVTSSAHLRAGRLHTLLTSNFTHLTFSELFLTVGGIVWFGGGVARAIGARRFLRVYAACGIASAVVAARKQEQDGQAKVYFGARGAVNAMVVIFAAIKKHVIGAPLVYLVLEALDMQYFCPPVLDSSSRHVGHASGLLWGAMYAVHLRRGLRMVL